ncbi:hypothetical protein CR152_25800 [Massilia violaceinigra]|uniref:Uncharacterized protein n=1 Tax=Massilia violaceinigra TaxID=2045208 RepID=A0A2D2DRD1_9BURK|nr:hypothetical protein CR152_25800 [Massilia violaceinigra]
MTGNGASAATNASAAVSPNGKRAVPSEAPPAPDRTTSRAGDIGADAVGGNRCKTELLWSSIHVGQGVFVLMDVF